MGINSIVTEQDLIISSKLAEQQKIKERLKLEKEF